MSKNLTSRTALIVGVIALAWLSGLTVYLLWAQNGPNIMGLNIVECSVGVDGTPYKVYATVNGQTVVADEESGTVTYSFQAKKGSQIYIHGFGDNGMTVTLTINNQLIKTDSGTRPSIYYSVPW